MMFGAANYKVTGRGGAVTRISLSLHAAAVRCTEGFGRAALASIHEDVPPDGLLLLGVLAFHLALVLKVFVEPARTSIEERIDAVGDFREVEDVDVPADRQRSSP